MKDFKRILFKTKKHESKSPEPENLKQFLSLKEKEKIEGELRRNGYNIARTARVLGISRQSLQYRMKRLNIETRGDL